MGILLTHIQPNRALATPPRRTDVRKRLVAYSVLLFVAEKIGKNYINPPRFLLSASADRYSPSPLCDPGRNTGTRVTLEAAVSARRPWLMALTASLRSRFFCCSQLLSICLRLNKTVRFGVVHPAVVHMLRVLVQKNHKPPLLWSDRCDYTARHLQLAF